MSAFQSPGEISLESLPDAPDGQWLSDVLENYNQTQRQLVSALKQGLTTTDNTTSDEKQLTLAHGVEIQCSSPLDVPIRGVYVLACAGLVLDSQGKSTGQVYQLDTPSLSWRPTGKADGSVYLKATYPAPLGSVDIRRMATQAISLNTETPLQFDTTVTDDVGALSCVTATTSGSPPINSRIVCAQTGTILVTSTVTFDTSVAGVKFSWFVKNNDLTTRFGNSGSTVTGFCIPCLSSQISVSAGDYIEQIAYQSSVPSLNILGGSDNGAALQARYVAPAANTLGRLNLFFYGG